MRKKLLTLVLVAVMVICGLSIMTPMEVEAATNIGTSEVEITKTLSATGLEDTTFYFTVEEYSMSDTPASVTSIPDISDFTITVSEGDTTGSYTITLPDYEGIGIYTYKITETKGSVAGVTVYSDAELYLVVTVTNDNGNLSRSAVVYLGYNGDKNKKEFANTYEAGTLTVTKEVTGDLGDTTKEFTVVVTFTKDNDVTINSTISYTVGGTDYTIEPSDWSGNTATATITVKDNSTVEFTNVPYGIEYAVVENDYTTNDGYTTTYDGTDGKAGTGTINSTAENVEITDYKNSTASTGVILDNLPYILILAVVLLGVVYLIFRRRSSDMD